MFDIFKDSRVYPTNKKYYTTATDELLNKIEKLFILCKSEKEIINIENYIKDSFIRVNPRNEDLLGNILFDLTAWVTNKLNPLSVKKYRSIETETAPFTEPKIKVKESNQGNKPYIQYKKGDKITNLVS